MSKRQCDDLHVEKIGHVTLIEIQRPPLNYFDLSLIRQFADALGASDQDTDSRAVVIVAQGKAFCAGANFATPSEVEIPPVPGNRAPDILNHSQHLYNEAVRIFRNKKPIVAPVHGAAIGGGLGLALSADFRIACPETRFAANFTKLGFHPGFGLTVTLVDLVGMNIAELMFYTSRRIGGEEAVRIGLANRCVPRERVRAEALAPAQEIAECAPLGLLATRATLRDGLADKVLAATERELVEQTKLRATDDFREGSAHPRSVARRISSADSRAT